MSPRPQHGPSSRRLAARLASAALVVLLVGGDATAFDTTYTTYAASYAQSTIDSNSHDFVVEY